jgi:hypothetical protein
MDQLSADIVRAIVDTVDRKDVFALRLTCHAFAAAAAPRLFEVIPVMMLFRSSLESLQQISQHPVYRNYVLTIEFGHCAVREPLSREDWIHNVNWNSRNIVPDSELDKACMCHFRPVVALMLIHRRARPKP